MIVSNNGGNIMSKLKKILISSIITFSLMIMGIIGLIINNNQQPPQYARAGTYNTTQGIVENINETPQIKYYNYAPNTIKVVKGSDVINFSYKPSNKVNYAQQPLNTNVSEQSTIHTQAGTSSINPKYVKNIDARAGQTIAYEYVFGNTMNRTAAVNLKSIGDISESGVTVSYLWRTTPLTQGEAVTNSPAKFTCQEMANKGDKVYLYVIVSSESSSVSADFTTNIKWYYGVPYDMPIYNNVDNNSIVTTIKLVNGQEYTSDVLPDEEDITVPEGYYFDTWYADKDCTELATDTTLKATQPVYLRCHNVPTGVTTYMTYDSTTESYIASTECASLVTATNTKLIIPTYYDNGTNGRHLVTSIATKAFSDCSSLTSITIPSSVTSIGIYAFSSCSSLTSITIPSSVTSIGSSAFYNCYVLAEVYNLSSLTLTMGTSDNGGIAQYAKVIHTSASTPSKIITINGVAYYKESDSSYIALTLADKTKISVTLDSRTTSINQCAFDSCSSLTSITIPSSVTSIGSGAFSSCSSLTSITIPSSVTSIGDYAFSSCSSLTSLDLSNCTNLTSIGNAAFDECSSLTSVDLSNCTNLTSIGMSAFSDCSSLTSITIPSSVTSIGWYAFNGCSKLTSITFEDTSTWYRTNNRTNWANKTGGTQTDVSNASTNATYFTKSTSNGGYYNYYWYKL